MARPQAFEHDQVLTDAMRVFWRQGYTATSIKDLTEATHLQPGSLYAAFKNKRNLFLQSLDHYFNDLHADVVRLLHSDSPPLQRIHEFFAYLLEQVERDTEFKGCLLVNTLLEIPANDEEINQRVSSMLQTVEKEFCQVLEEAQHNGDITPTHKPDELARMLITGIFGLRVYNRMQPDTKAMQTVVDNLLSVLDYSH